MKFLFTRHTSNHIVERYEYFPLSVSSISFCIFFLSIIWWICCHLIKPLCSLVIICNECKFCWLFLLVHCVLQSRTIVGILVSSYCFPDSFPSPRIWFLVLWHTSLCPLTSYKHENHAWDNCTFYASRLQALSLLINPSSTRLLFFFFSYD